MNALKQLNRTENKPYNGLPKLSIGFHKIVDFHSSDGVWGRSVIVELKNEIISLPKHLANDICEDDINELNSVKEPIFLYFGGQRENKTNDYK